MADKQISDLAAATQITSNDLFVLEQSNTAKKLEGQVLINWLTSHADGHGGIQSISKTGTSGLVDTYTITYADLTTGTFTVTNGKALASVTQYFAVSDSDSDVPEEWSTTRQDMTVVDRYLWSYFTFTYTDTTTEDTTPSVIGVYGDTGPQSYVWIKYCDQEPLDETAELSDIPDEWIGIYTGIDDEPPAIYSDYTWYRFKGTTGDPAEILQDQTSVGYAVTDTWTGSPPSGNWYTYIPTIDQGNYLWTRVILKFNTGEPVVFYGVSRFGINGEGAVNQVCGKDPDGSGNVVLIADNIDTDTVDVSIQDALDSIGTTITTLQKKLLKISGISISAASTSQQIGSVTNAAINSNMVVLRSSVGTPSSQTSDWTITTSDTAPQLTVTGTASASTTLTVILGEV